MASVSFYFDCRRKTKDGLYPVSIRVHSCRSVAMMNTGVKVGAEQWDAENGMVVKHPFAARFNMVLQNKLNDVRMKVNDIVLSAGGDITAKEIMAFISPEKIEKRKTEKDRKELVANLFDTFVEAKEKKSTRDVFIGTRNKVDAFCDWETLKFKDIDYEWLVRFDAFMRNEGNSVNTRSIHMRNVRTLYNEAIRMGWIGQDGYPFRAFRIKTEDTEKRSLSVEQLRELRDFQCEEHVRKYVDVFFISFYLAGINMVDLLELPHIPKDGVIRYRRNKTGVLCQLTVPPEARVLIDKYRGKERMLCFGEQYRNYKDFLHRMNENLRKVGEVYFTYMTASNGARHRVKNHRALFPTLTSYWARHTWATIAADIDVPDAVIDAALGHKSMYRMTDIYVKRNAKKVDEAVRLVINYLNER